MIHPLTHHCNNRWYTANKQTSENCTLS